MEHFKRIQDFEQIKILTDPRRLAILRMLMAAPATLTQLGQALNEHPARVRHHLKLLEKAGLVELTNQRVVRGFVEKYYRAKARSFLFQEIVVPKTDDEVSLTCLGSHDLALETLAYQLRILKYRPLGLFVLPIGSLDGLIALRQGISQVTGCHLLDFETGEYNLPFISHIFPDRSVRLITLAHRQQGLLVAPGNPLGIRDMSDLARGEVRMINRNKGSATRLWLDRQINQLSIDPRILNGYNREVRTHSAVAEAIQTGKADMGLGLLAAAQKLKLDFVPLFEERFDLVFPEDQTENPTFTTMFDTLSSARFRRLLQNLGGYGTEHTGDEIHLES